MRVGVKPQGLPTHGCEQPSKPPKRHRGDFEKRDPEYLRTLTPCPYTDKGRIRSLREKPGTNVTQCRCNRSINFYPRSIETGHYPGEEPVSVLRNTFINLLEHRPHQRYGPRRTDLRTSVLPFHRHPLTLHRTQSCESHKCNEPSTTSSTIMELGHLHQPVNDITVTDSEFFSHPE